MSDDLVKQARHNVLSDMPHYASVELIAALADRIEELEAQRNFAQRQVVAAETKLAKAVEALELMCLHPHGLEKQLTEDLFHQDFCGESVPLTVARTILAELKGQDDE